MGKFLLLLFSFFMVGCNANETLIDPLKPELDTMYFDVVQKKLLIEQDLPDQVNILVAKWFDEKVKINGFDGDMTFTVTDYKQNITHIIDGKRVDISLSFKLRLRKPLLSKIKLIEGEVSSYGTLSGDFSLSEFDTVIQNTQSDLISRLSRDLVSKI